MNSLLNLLSTTLSHSLMVWLINFMVLGNYGICSEGHDKKGTRGVIEIGEGKHTEELVDEEEVGYAEE